MPPNCNLSKASKTMTFRLVVGSVRLSSVIAGTRVLAINVSYFSARQRPPSIERRLTLRALNFVAACAFAIAGFSFNATASRAAPRPLVIYVEEDPSSLNTILNTAFGWQLGPLTQGYLFTVDDLGRLVPDAALELPTRRNGGISADGRTIVYRIRTGRWSDGAPFDARDVAFTIDALRNPATNVPDRSTIDAIASVRVPQPDRLVVELRAPSAPFVSSFLTLGANDPFAILPRHIAARYANLNSSSLDTHPVGLGPYRLVTWRRGDRLTFEPNPFYWRGRPKLERIVALVEPNATTRLVQARTGNLDVTYISGLQLDEAAREHLRVVRATTNIVDYLQFNVRGSRALGDPLVRRAIAQALDRPRLAATVYRGQEEPTDTGQLAPALARAGRLPAFDPRAARAALRGPIDLDFAIAGQWRSSASAALQIAAQLANIGVTARLHSYSTSSFWGAKSAGGVLENGRFDLALTSWSPSLDADRSYLFGCAAVPPTGGNAGGYCNRAFDAAEERGMRTYDPAARTAAYRTAHAILARDLPIVPIGFERSAYVVSPRVVNFRPNVLGRDYWNAWEWEVNDR